MAGLALATALERERAKSARLERDLAWEKERRSQELQALLQQVREKRALIAALQAIKALAQGPAMNLDAIYEAAQKALTEPPATVALRGPVRTTLSQRTGGFLSADGRDTDAVLAAIDSGDALPRGEEATSGE